MKSFAFISVLLLIISYTADAQIRVGLRIAPGLGYLRSKNLNNLYEKIETLEKETFSGDVSYNVSSRLRSHFSLGGFLEYKLSNNVFASAEPVLTLSSNKIFITSVHDNVDDNGNGTVVRTYSDARIKAPYISLPLSAKFRFNHRRELFVFGGPVLNFHFTPRLISKEEVVITNYIDGTSTNYPETEVDNRFKLKSYRFLNLNFMVGIGKVFNPYGRNVVVDIRYSIPLTKSTAHKEGEAPEAIINNHVYTNEGINAINTVYPQYPLSDYKMGVISLSIAYTIYKNYR